jgi:hypothetical protein
LYGSGTNFFPFYYLKRVVWSKQYSPPPPRRPAPACPPPFGHRCSSPSAGPRTALRLRRPLVPVRQPALQPIRGPEDGTPPLAPARSRSPAEAPPHSRARRRCSASGARSSPLFLPPNYILSGPLSLISSAFSCSATNKSCHDFELP